MHNLPVSVTLLLHAPTTAETDDPHNEKRSACSYKVHSDSQLLGEDAAENMNPKGRKGCVTARVGNLPGLRQELIQYTNASSSVVNLRHSNTSRLDGMGRKRTCTMIS